MPSLRPELTRPLPKRIATLPIEARGYPVPWFVPWLADGTPEFRGMDVVKWSLAVRDRRCWICGGPLGRFLAFVVGPMCGVNRTSSEPPSHRDCATWAAINCPFLSRPHMVRREDATVNAESTKEMAGFGLRRNPGVTLVWVTTSYQVFVADAGGNGNGGRLVEMGPPHRVAWYAAGRPATRAEIEASVAGGLPALEALCDQDLDPVEARAELRRRLVALKALYPVEAPVEVP
jgi:hypothetical protein